MILFSFHSFIGHTRFVIDGCFVYAQPATGNGEPVIHLLFWCIYRPQGITFFEITKPGSKNRELFTQPVSHGDTANDWCCALLYLFQFTIGDNCSIDLLCRALADNGFGKKAFLG